MNEITTLSDSDIDSLSAEELALLMAESDVAELLEGPTPVTTVAPVEEIVEETEETVEETETPGIFGAIEATNKIEEALTFGGVDYEVETFPIRPVISGVGDEDSPEPEEDWMIPNFVGVRRMDDRKVVFGIQTTSYKIVQNREIFEFIRPLLEVTGGTFTRVGTLMRGARMFAFLTLAERIELSNGVYLNQNLAITSSHDGCRCLEVSMVATLADTGTIVSKGKAYELRHTRNVHVRLDQVVKIMEIKNEFFLGLTEKVAALKDVTMTDADANTWLEKFLEFPEQKDVTVHASKVAAKERILVAFKRAVTAGNTRLAMALAVAHDRSHTVPVKETKRFQSEAESRFRSVLTGSSSEALEEAWASLLAK